MHTPGGQVTARLLGRGGQTTDLDSDQETISGWLDDGEPVVYRLRTDDPVVRQTDETATRVGAADTGCLVAVTDRRLVLGSPDADAAGSAIAYTDVRSISATDGILSSRLTVDVWGDGTYRLAPTNVDAEVVADYLERVTDIHQRVTAALESAREAITDLGRRLEGDDRPAETRREVERQLDLARDRLASARLHHDDYLLGRVETVETEFQRTRVRGHLARGQVLAGQGDRATGREEWTVALDAFDTARDHMETAHRVARDRDFRLAEAIESALADLDDRVDRLRARPLELAEADRRRAQAAADPEDEIPSWESALDHYHAALTAGWGRVSFEGEKDALRMQVEWVVANLIESRRALADKLAASADDVRAANPTAARTRYGAAAEQVARAAALAREFHAGDAEALAARRRELVASRNDVA